MPVAPGVSNISELLTQKYGDLGAAAAERLRVWLSGSLPYTYPEILEKHLDDSRIDLEEIAAAWALRISRKNLPGFIPNAKTSASITPCWSPAQPKANTRPICSACAPTLAGMT